MHRFLLTATPAERHEEFHRMLIGPPGRPRTVDARVGIQPPSWWHGDEYATRSSLAAAAQLRHGA